MADVRHTASDRYPGLSVWLDDRERLIMLACRVVESRAVAEEIVQEGWLRWQSRGYSAPDARPLFRRIVSNLARDWRRRQRFESIALDQHALHRIHAFDTERLVSAQQHVALVAEAMATMPPRMVQALWLHRMDGRTYAKIGSELGVAPSTAHKLVEDALVRLMLAIGD